MRYEILGPLQAVDSNGGRTLSAQKMEVLLASLLIRADQVVSTSQLIDEIWGHNPPRRATAALHVYISQLRKFLYDPLARQSPISTRTAGYQLGLAGAELDLDDFKRWAAVGRSRLNSSRFEEAAAALDRALALWRGPVLGDLRAGPIIDGFAAWAEETRLECTQMLMDAKLALGQHRELVGRLRTLVTDYPLYEAFYQQLMLALYRSDRQADALQVYWQAQSTLGAELGLEPCRPLRELHTAILTSDRRLDLMAAG